MKSNYGGVTLNRQVRALEARTLCDAIDAIRAGHNRYTQTQGIAPLRDRRHACAAQGR